MTHRSIPGMNKPSPILPADYLQSLIGRQSAAQLDAVYSGIPVNPCSELAPRQGS